MRSIPSRPDARTFRRNRRRIRRGLFFAQDGRCFYCGEDCWEPSIETAEKAAARLGFPDNAAGEEGRFFRRTVLRRRATIDHRMPASKFMPGDNAKHSKANLVMACHRCNVAKKDLSDEAFMDLIAKHRLNLVPAREATS